MHDLQDIIVGEVARGRGHLEDRLVVRSLAQEHVEELGSLEPPVAEQLRVVGADDDRVDRHLRAEGFELLDAIGEEVGRMRVGRALRPRTVVEFLVRGAAGDAVVFQAGEFALSVRSEERPQVVEAEVVADVAVEVAVSGVARVALLGAPDLAARVAVAGEDGRPFGRVAGRVDGHARLRLPEHQAVGVEHEPAQVGLAQEFLHPRVVGAFG